MMLISLYASRQTTQESESQNYKLNILILFEIVGLSV